MFGGVCVYNTWEGWACGVEKSKTRREEGKSHVLGNESFPGFPTLTSSLPIPARERTPRSIAGVGVTCALRWATGRQSCWVGSVGKNEGKQGSYPHLSHAAHPALSVKLFFKYIQSLNILRGEQRTDLYVKCQLWTFVCASYEKSSLAIIKGKKETLRRLWAGAHPTRV